MQEALHILKKYWGYDEFRPLQWPIISDLLEKKDIIALLPTGGGKSVCFQVPALLQPGICIVVSPLIALMEDQVSSLHKNGIKAMAVTGGISYDDLDKKLDNCIYGNYKFLYLSPERLQQELVQERIKQMDVNLIAVDEAHCISQWGHDFRPAYRNINKLKELLPETPLAALTATATPEVVKDIKKELELEGSVLHKKSFARPNIAYNVLKAEDKFYRLSRLLKSKSETAIIYVRSRKATIDISEHLNKEGYRALAFHGGLKNEEKSKRLNMWLANESYIMVATTAFGMGIDKPDVRQVIHLNLPESLESYFQEAGRAGRDGKPAAASIITSTSDIPVLKNQFLASLPDVKDIKQVYRKLNSYFQIAFGEGEQTTENFNFSDFCEQYSFNALKTYNCLQVLDRCSILKLSQQFHKKTEVQFIISSAQLDHYLSSHSAYDDLVKAMLRTYGGILENKTSINLNALCKKAGITEDKAIDILKRLEADEIIEFNYAAQDTSITFLVPREDEATINPVASYIRLQYDTKTSKIEAVLSFIENEKECKSQQLLKYFGETETSPCGICSVCNKENTEISRSVMNNIYKEIVLLLKKRELNSRALTEQIDLYREEHILKVLQLLVERKIILRTPTNNYKLPEK
ncbi:RecQ family ATP-dependent DNA helicase [Salegentibacter chungangensis]|uniref:ATP-dependent DNA helicase RecQ n=1 Tax=Salegentibacter chungangensis TaxID=1335724 RepID=A0ABW3NS47_9FLAO